MDLEDIVFFTDGLTCFRKVVKCIKSNRFLSQLVETVSVIETDMNPYLTDLFDQKLATILFKNKMLISHYDVITEVNAFVKKMLLAAIKEFPSENSTQSIVESYPVFLASEVCGTSRAYSHIIGECVKKLILFRKTYTNWLPEELYPVIESNITLTGQEKSPLSKNELEALYAYLKCKKSIYVHIYLNSLYEIGRDCDLLGKIMDEEELYTFCNSSWLYLIFFHHSQFSVYSK